MVMPIGQPRKIKGAICNVPVECDLLYWIHCHYHRKRQSFDVRTLNGNLRGVALYWEA